MTLCLAGVCKAGDAIAFVFDERLTTNTTTADVLNKGARVAPGWALLFAGSHINQVGSVYDRLKRETLSKPAASLAEMQMALVDVQTRVFLEEVVPNVLPLGVTYQEFKRDPTKIANHQSIQRKLNEARDGCDFLLAGFDDRGLGHVVLLPAQQGPLNCDRIGYGAIGSGCEVAEHYLAVCKYATDLEDFEAVYHLCAAKFFAESGAIGPGTRIALLKKDGTRLMMDWEPVRKLWDHEGRPKVPSSLRARMPAWDTSTPTSFGKVPKAKKRGR
jgi:hypothetical protein